MTENMHRNISGTAENVACVAGGICVRVLYILFLRPKIEFRIVFAAEPREEWAQYGEEGRPCLPNILVKIEKFHFNLANVKPRSKRSLNIVNNVPNLFLLALFCSLNVK